MRRSVVSLVVLLSSFAGAAPPRPDQLPAALKDWQAWVLHAEKEAGCPFLNGAEARICAWPGRLALSLDDKGGRFTQAFRVYREAWLSLPGDPRRWPQDVKVDGKAAVVVPGADGQPTVKLVEGEHQVTGDFVWDALPEALLVPRDTGLVALTLKGAEVTLPNRDDEGRVFLQKESTAKEEEDLDLTVHRLLSDDIPARLVTRLSLQVSGKSREVVLGRAQPDGFVPMALSSTLPVRLEPDGKLRLQVRPGAWVVTLEARSEGPLNALKRPDPQGAWMEGDEVWTFDARPSLRQVLVEGVNQVDPQQTTLPNEWKRFPAYAMALTDELRMTERRRGDADPSPDSLTLTRTLWLDFDGKGLTANDRISGPLHRSWRLDMQSGTDLGRVVTAGSDQFITRLAAGKLAGVELREGQLTLEADSRITAPLSAIPAVSWDADFTRVSTTLQLPPGWTLVSAAGADSVPDTWLQRWTLLDLFLVLIISLAVGRLFGWPFGALSLLALMLGWQETDAPKLVWVVVLVLEALYRVLPDNWLKATFRWSRFAAWAALVVIAVSFMVDHVRHGMYPALAQTTSFGGVQSWSEYSTDNERQYQRNQYDQNELEEAPSGFAGDKEVDEDGYGSIPLPRKAEPRAPMQQQVRRKQLSVRDYDKTVLVQTGPGLPRWSWKSVNIGYSGPVERSQTLSLFLIGPTGNLLLAFLRVVLLALLVLTVLGFPGAFWPPALKKLLRPGATAGALLLALLTPALASANEVPPEATLNELKTRLLERPECAPRCASSPRLLLEATPTLLRLRLEVLAGATTAVPLPGNEKHWLPRTVLVDGQPANALKRGADGALLLAVTEGAHQVVLEGPLPPRDTVQVPLPLKSYRVESKVDGWTLDGVHEDGVADENLQLTRKAGGDKATGAGAALQTGTLPPFVVVERMLALGLTWSVETTVRRLTPTGSAVVLEVPLLPGESVTSSEVRVQNGKALVNMPATTTDFSWTSVLEAKSPLALSAPKGLPWVEVWRIDVSPVWHAEWSGIPVVHQPDQPGVRVPEWRPWPGEAVTIEVVKPEGVQGQTLTIDQSRLVVSPGVRATDATFTANFRSSRGGLHPFTLPGDAQLQSVVINGQAQPIRQEGRAVAIPLVPGSQSVELVWRQTAGVTSSWTTPPLSMGLTTVNAELQVQVPADRWVLFVTGPRMGPAVLFWSFLLVLLVVSLGLGRARWAPVKTYQWVLLALGLSQLPIFAIAIVFGWLLLLGWRERVAIEGTHSFNFRQFAVVMVTAMALIVLGVSVYEGLLGQPEMQVRGNGSSAWALRWFQDRTTTDFPLAWVFSVPMLVYRGAMLAWSLWMALALLSWLKWGWKAFSTGGLWKASPKVLRPSVPTTPPPGAAPK
ncbi:MAG: hypothetical protein JNJ54_01775 [Myxococcaceae bacterium]|nr:hypothetical protein [Myxococcaceae bacterium]